MGSSTNSHPDTPQSQLPLTLIWVERTADSTAAGAHLRGTIARLTDPRFTFTIFTQESDGVRWLPGPARQALRILNVIGRARWSRPRGVLLARWSPFIALVSRRWRRRGLPVVLFVQGNLDDLHDSNPWTRSIGWITSVALDSIRGATHIVTPSEGLADWVTSIRGGDRASVTVIPNGVDVDLFAQARLSAADEAVAPHALFFGNMAGWQGIDTVLDALAQPQWPADLGLRFIGDGQLASAVVASTDPRVEYLGRLPKAQVARAAATAELTLATRHADGASSTGVSPFKIIESAAAGTPCVATRVPGQTELAEDIGGAALIPADDAEALADAVALLHADQGLRERLSAQGLRGVSRYDWAAHGDTLVSIVLDASNPSRPEDVAPIGGAPVRSTGTGRGRA